MIRMPMWRTAEKRQEAHEAKVLACLARYPNGKQSSAQVATDTRLLSGVLYPALIRLEGRGQIASAWEDRKATPVGEAKRRLYWITAVGLERHETSKASIPLNESR